MNIANRQKNGIVFPNSIVDEEWEYLDPTPDIHALFLQFDDRFFNGQLKSVEVKWSSRMTVCAGLCRYEGRRSGHCSISLSVPLLKLRPRKDLVETLLHEMIHAFLFLTNNNRDRDGHGPEFQSHMHRINQESGTKITIYHSFHDEVKLYKQHWWKCNGPCKDRPPFHGFVKRSMNRAPGPNDIWWAQHQASCGGSYVKIKEPEGYGVKKKKENTEKKAGPDSKKPKVEVPSSTRDIRGFLTSPIAGPSTGITSGNASSSGKTSSESNIKINTPSKGSKPSGLAGKNNGPTNGKSISGYFNSSSDSSAKGKTVTGFAGMMNKGSSTITVKASSVGSTEKEESTDARPTQGGVVARPQSNTSFIPFSGSGRVLGGGMVPNPEAPSRLLGNGPAFKIEKIPPPLVTKSVAETQTKIVEVISLDDSHDDIIPKEEKVPCPVCLSLIAVSQVNSHLDSCLLS